MLEDIDNWKKAPLWNKSKIKYATKNGLNMLNNFKF